MSNCKKEKLLQCNNNFFATQNFFRQFKCGLVDVTQISTSLNKYNCLLLNVAFANYWISNSIDITTALVRFTGSDTSSLDLYLSANNINNTTLFLDAGLPNAINALANEIQRPIVVLEHSKKANIYYEICLLYTSPSPRD